MKKFNQKSLNIILINANIAGMNVSVNVRKYVLIENE